MGTVSQRKAIHILHRLNREAIPAIQDTDTDIIVQYSTEHVTASIKVDADFIFNLFRTD